MHAYPEPFADAPPGLFDAAALPVAPRLVSKESLALPPSPPYAPMDERPRCRIWFVSDLRIDLAPCALPDRFPECDALVVCGNVGPGVAASIGWLARQLDRARGDLEIAFVAGPVEFGDGVPVADALGEGAVAAEAAGIRLLHDASFRLGDATGDGIHVLGSTLWTDFSIDGPETACLARGHARARWADARAIRRGAFAPFMPHDAAGAHARGRAFIEDALATIWAGGEGFRPRREPLIANVRGGDRAVVATAFPPSRACLPPRLAHPLLDPWTTSWRASNLDGILDAPGAPAAWLAGGVPFALDMRLGRTRVVANPRQQGDPTGGFEIGRVVTV